MADMKKMRTLGLPPRPGKAPVGTFPTQKHDNRLDWLNLEVPTSVGPLRGNRSHRPPINDSSPLSKKDLLHVLIGKPVGGTTTGGGDATNNHDLILTTQKNGSPSSDHGNITGTNANKRRKYEPEPEEEVDIEIQKLRRTLANRQSQQKSRQRKIKYTAELEVRVRALQDQVLSRYTQLGVCKSQHSILEIENSTLKVRMAFLMDQDVIKDAQIKMLKEEGDKLRQQYMLRELERKQFNEQRKAAFGGVELPNFINMNPMNPNSSNQQMLRELERKNFDEQRKAAFGGVQQAHFNMNPMNPNSSNQQMLRELERKNFDEQRKAAFGGIERPNFNMNPMNPNSSNCFM